MKNVSLNVSLIAFGDLRNIILPGNFCLPGFLGWKIGWIKTGFCINKKHI